MNCEDPMEAHNDSFLWEPLLKQAEANLETARAMHLQTQRMMSKESAVDMEPDRLEAWYIADRDSEAGADIAGQIVCKGVAPAIGKHTAGSKRRIPPSLSCPLQARLRENQGRPNV